MATILNLKRIKSKTELKCPLEVMGHTELACRHEGVTLDNAGSAKVFSIYSVVMEAHKRFKYKPIEYGIYNTNTLLGALPITASPDVLLCERKDLFDTLIKAYKTVIKNKCPCFSLSIFYNELYDNIYVLTEYEHE